ncbi:MAG: acyl carrier protein [Candidatus Binatia bacterium]
MNVSTLARVQRIVADVLSLSVETIGPHDSPETLKRWDSLRHLSIVLAVEQEFAVQFTPEEIEQLVSVGVIAGVLGEKLVASETHL